MEKKRVSIYERLPEIYRIKDQEQQPVPGQLKGFMEIFEQAFALIHENIELLYNDNFVETCQEWLIPYIGDLLGSSHLKGDPWTLRADVADTIALRSRKGTLFAIERLAFNLTQWGVHCVELRENLVWTQHINHQRPDAGINAPYGLQNFLNKDKSNNNNQDSNHISTPNLFTGKTDVEVKDAAVTNTDAADELIRRYEKKPTTDLMALAKTGDSMASYVLEKRKSRYNVLGSGIRGGTVSIRDPAFLSLIKTPFDPFGYTPDLSIPNFGSINYNLPNLAIYLWRLKVYKVIGSKPVITSHNISTATNSDAKIVVRVRIHPLGQPVRLFNTHRFHSSNVNPILQPMDTLTELNRTPGPIPRSHLTDGAPSSNPSDYVRAFTYDDEAHLSSLSLNRDDVCLQLYIPQSLFKTDRWLFRGADLCAWEGGLKSKIRNREIIIDPVIGRMLIGVNTDKERDALLNNLLITYSYGSVGPVGAHPTNRLSLSSKKDKEILSDKDVIPKIIEVNLLKNKKLQEALDSIKNSSSPIVIEINDSLTHEVDIESVLGESTTDKSLKLNNSLVIKAADNQRPILRLVRPLKLSPSENELNGLSKINVRLEGLYLTRSDHFVNSSDPLIAQVALDRLEIINCTLDPGSFKKTDDSIAPSYKALELDAHYGFVPGSTTEKVFNKIPKIIIHRSITGPIFIEGEKAYSLSINDSIIDAGENNTEINAIPPTINSFAISGNGKKPWESWGPPTEINGTTVYGWMRVRSINGRGNIWKNTLEVLDNQRGCLKFCYFCGKMDRLPQNYGCVNVNENMAKLHFTSENFGEPGYGQLGYYADFRIKERGPDDNEMGAYGFLEEANKWRNIRIRFREFMPIGVKPLLIPVT